MIFFEHEFDYHTTLDENIYNKLNLYRVIVVNIFGHLSSADYLLHIAHLILIYSSQ